MLTVLRAVPGEKFPTGFRQFQFARWSISVWMWPWHFAMPRRYFCPPGVREDNASYWTKVWHLGPVMLAWLD